MKLKINNQLVNVNHAECCDHSCLVVGRYTHHSAAGASGCSSWADSNLSCLTRDNKGCPPEDGRRTNPDILHRCDVPRFAWNVKSDKGPRVRCLTCKQLVPRWVAKAQQERTKR